MSWKSFFHRLGDVAKNASMATPLGMLWDTADSLVDPEEGQSRLGSLEDRIKGRGLANVPGVGLLDSILKTSTATNPDKPDEGSFGLLDAAHFPYDYGINRPASTVNGVLNALYWDHKNPLSGSLWRKEWNLSDTVSQGQQAAAGSILYRQKLGNLPPNSPEARDYFQHDPVGKIQSGALDFISNVVADPLLYGGKGIKAARLANTTFKDATVRDATFGLARGDITAEQAAEQYGVKVAKRAVKNQTALEKFLSSTRGMNKAQLSQLAPLRDTSDAGAIAYWLERADRAAVDDADALSRKLDIFGVVAGNRESIEKLTSRQAELAEEMRLMSSPVETTNALASFKWGDYGQSMYDMLNRRVPPAVVDRNTKIDQIDQELARLDRLYGIRGSTSKFAANSLERAQQGARLRDIQESVLYNGMASKPIRVVRGTVGKAPQGFVNTRIADDGLDEMRRLLGRSSMDADTRAKLLDRFASAGSREARVFAAVEAERQIFKAEGLRFGKSRAEIEKLLAMANGRRTVIHGQLKTKLYSASPEAKYVRFTDEDGYEHAFDRPFLQSQLDDAVPVTDPKVLQRVLKQEARRPWLAAMTEGGSRVTDVVEQAAAVGTRVWKDMQLFRIAYPLRIQVDTQMRLMASLGALQYLATAGRGTVNFLSNHNFIANDIERLTGEAAPKARQSILAHPETFGTYVDQKAVDRLTPQIEKLDARIAARSTRRHKQEITDALIAKRNRLQAELDEAKAIPVPVQPALSDEDLARLDRTLQSSTSRDLAAVDVTNNVLRDLRATGDFDVVSGSDRNWSVSMLRALNHQIRNSPTAMKTLQEGDDNLVAQWLHTNPAGRAEWRSFASEYDGDPMPWIMQIRAHLNHTVPTPELRSRLLERPITPDDLDELFKDVASRPQVHGETYVPFIQSPLARFGKTLRDGWYKWASDTPETVMGRHPLYNARFREHMREAVARRKGDTITSDDVKAMRRVADRKARKDVADTLFDLSSMSNLAHLSRFLMPFFAAWEDTMVKWGKLLYDDPSRAIRLEQVWTAPEKADVTLVDDQGQEYVILPGMFSPFGSKGWRVRKDSWNIVFQGEPWWLPGFGPLVQVPVNELVLKLFSDKADHPALKYILPYGVDEQGIKHQLMPSWARKAQAAFAEDSADYRNTYTMLLDQELVKYTLGQRKTPPTREEIAKATRNWHLMRALTAFAAPVSADPTPEFQYYIDKAHEYSDQDQQTRTAFKAWQASGAQGPPPPRDWRERFYRDYPQYFEMSVSLSMNNTGIVASDKAFQAIKRHRKLIAEHPELGWLIVGPDNNGDFSQGVYAFQQSQTVGGGSTMTFRGTKDPSQAIDDAEVSKGWMMYRKGMTMIDLELEARGLKSLSQRGAEDLLEAKREFVSDLSNSNQAWGKAYGQHDDTKAESFIREALNIAKNRDLAKRPDFKAFAQYVEGRRVMREALKSRGAAQLPPEDSENSPNRDLRIAWDEFTSSLVNSNIGFEQMWQRALEADQLRNDI